MKDSLGIDRTALIDFSDFDIRLGKGYRRINHSGGAVRPMDRGLPGVLRCGPFEGEKCRDVRGVVIMKVSDENVGNTAQGNAGLNTGFERAIPKIDEIGPAVYHQRTRCLSPVRCNSWTALRTKQNQLRPRLLSGLP